MREVPDDQRFCGRCGVNTKRDPAPPADATATSVTDAPAELRLGHDQPGVPGQDDWTSASDHGPFHAAGLPFVYFGVEDHPDYHQPTDDVEQVNPSDFHASVQTILSALRALDAALPLEPSP